LEEILALAKALADLGASPAVQALVMQEIARRSGISQAELDAAIAAQKDAPGPVG
jgi:hypothetical protein